MAAQQSKQGATILLVEDEPLIAMATAQKITRFGYEVVTAHTGGQAVEIATDNQKLSLILMDINLGPGIDGTEAARQILAIRRLPIVFLSSHTEEEYVSRVKEITRYGYVIKNSGDFVLKSSIDMAFELFKEHEKTLKNEAFLNATGQMAKVGGWEVDAESLAVSWTEETFRIHEVPLGYKPPLQDAINFFYPEDRKPLTRAIDRALQYGEPYDQELRFITAAGRHLWVRTRCEPVMRDGHVVKLRGTFQDISERKKVTEELQRLEWLLTKSVTPPNLDESPYQPPYGDVTALNTCRVILDSVGKETLKQIAEDTIDLLETSVAVYEKNGDYAFGMFSSGWCQVFDLASRRLCGDVENQEALTCGKWLCHEHCWNDSAKAAIDAKAPTDIACIGGIRLYAVPIVAGDDVVGVINIGYGDPPTDEQTLLELAEGFDMKIEDIRTTHPQRQHGVHGVRMPTRASDFEAFLRDIPMGTFDFSGSNRPSIVLEPTIINGIGKPVEMIDQASQAIIGRLAIRGLELRHQPVNIIVPQPLHLVRHPELLASRIEAQGVSGLIHYVPRDGDDPGYIETSENGVPILPSIRGHHRPAQ